MKQFEKSIRLHMKNTYVIEWDSTHFDNNYNQVDTNKCHKVVKYTPKFVQTEIGYIVYLSTKPSRIYPLWRSPLPSYVIICIVSMVYAITHRWYEVTYWLVHSSSLYKSKHKVY